MKKIVYLMVVTMLSGLILCGCGTSEKKTTDTKKEKVTESPKAVENTGDEKVQNGELLSGKHKAFIEIENYGTISLELDADTAPISVTNFVKLAKEGFYDGLTFHRIISGFMIQGGDPNGDGTGGSEETIKGEFLANGVENNLKHTRGVISMARSLDNDSASSQFFIMHEEATHLDGSYAAFGIVTEGMEIVDAICNDTPVTDDNGTVEKENQPKITKVTAE